jgi:hypothetical protein
MIVLISLFVSLVILGLLLSAPSMSEDQYELYFRTHVMGMTKSSLLSMETYQALQASVEQTRLQEKKLCDDIAKECIKR